MVPPEKCCLYKLTDQFIGSVYLLFPGTYRSAKNFHYSNHTWHLPHPLDNSRRRKGTKTSNPLKANINHYQIIQACLYSNK
jgi:hypothetical protein